MYLTSLERFHAALTETYGSYPFTSIPSAIAALATNCDCGVCATKGRITVCHKNVPAVISKITTVLGAAGINISSMANQSRGDYAYSLLDIEASAPEAVVEELSAIEGVIKVRVIK